MGMLISYPNDKKTSGGGGFSKLHQDLVSGQVAKGDGPLTYHDGSPGLPAGDGQSGELGPPQLATDKPTRSAGGLSGGEVSLFCAT